MLDGAFGEPDAGPTRTSGSGGRHEETDREQSRHRASCRPHHDIELMNAAGRRLARARLPEGVAGIERLHALIAEPAGEDADAAEVAIGIETDRGPWVSALVGADYTVYAVNPLQASRYRERHAVSGAKSDKADAHTLADMVRTDAHQLRPVAADSSRGEAVKVVARAHKTLIWERARQVQ